MAAPRLRCRKCLLSGRDGLAVSPADLPDEVQCLDCGHLWKSVHPQRHQRTLLAEFYDLNETSLQC